MGASIKVTGSFDRTTRFLTKMRSFDIGDILDSCGQQGVSALASAVPKDSGRAAGSWGYMVERSASSVRIVWTNTDIESGFPVAVMLQYGYGTGTGGYVQGRDYINPAMRPVFDQIAERVWKAVTSA